MDLDLSAEKIIKNSESLKSSRQTFDSMYQSLHNYFYVEGENITESKGKSQQLHALYDTTSIDCADVMAAGLSNFLTPDSSKWLFLQHSNRKLRDLDEVKAWMQDATEEVLWTLARSNFYNQMPIFYKASGVYGTAALMTEKDPVDSVRFYNIPIQKLYLTEDARERPYEFYLKFEYTAEQALSRFGDKCSNEIKEAYAAGRNEDKKFNFICYFGTRYEREPDKLDKLNMPVRMVWVDAKTKQVMKEDGFRSMPCVAHRFYKRSQVVYGYSPAMKALPHARMINVVSDTMLRSAMKQSDPAIALPDDVFLGTPNFNPRAINYYQRGQLNPRDEIFPIGNFGNPHFSVETLEYFKTQIREQMFYNTFLAFSEMTKQMTVPEVMERVSEKMTTLGPAVGRFMNDVLQPLIEKVVLILWEDNRLPRMPDVMLQDPSFEVKFVGRLVQSQRQSEVNNIVNALGIAAQVAQFNPEAADKVNTDAAVDEIFDISGVSTKILNNSDEVRKVREARAQAQAQEAQMLQAQTMAQTYKTAAEGDRNAKASQAER